MKPAEAPQTDEWRVEVHLDREASGPGFAKRLHELRVDDEARHKLGGSVIVTRDGDNLFLYGWREMAAREAEGKVRQLLEDDGLAATVSLMRWHPVEEAWKPADEPLPQTPEELEAEQQRHREAAEHEASNWRNWDVVIDLPSLKQTLELARKLEDERGLYVRRRFRYLLIGTPTEEDAIELGQELEAEVPEGAHVGVRANASDLPTPGFVLLGSLKPGALRDLGL